MIDGRNLNMLLKAPINHVWSWVNKNDICQKS